MGSPVQRLVLFMATLCTVSAAVQAEAGDELFSQHLDRFEDPLWNARLGTVARSEVKTEGGKKFGVIEFEAGSGLAYFDTGAGHLDLRTAFMTRVFDGNGGIALPDQAGLLHLSLTLTHRLQAGYALQLGLEPGLYTDFKDFSGDDLALPIRIILFKSLAESLSALAGVAVFPGFERPLDPRLGLRWCPGTALFVDLAYPESRVVLDPGAMWRLAAGLRVPTYREFQLQKDDPRDRLVYDEYRLYANLELALSAFVRLKVEGGRLFGREVDYAESASRADVEDALFLNVGLGGYL